LSYIAILVKIYKVPAEVAVQSTIMARLADMLTSMLVVVVLLGFVSPQLGATQPVVLLSMLLCAGVIVLAVAVFALARGWKRPPDSGTAKIQRPWEGTLRRTVEFGIRVIRLDARYVKSTFPKLFFYSLIIQFITAAAMYCNVRAFNLDIGYLEAAFVGVVSAFLASVPITVFGGLGVYELSTVTLLQVFGVPLESGTAMIFVIRAAFFMMMAIALFAVPTPTNDRGEQARSASLVVR
jgi:uncharacterized membrane protein YbhN (UPF0104 family)